MAVIPSGTISKAESDCALSSLRSLRIDAQLALSLTLRRRRHGSTRSAARPEGAAAPAAGSQLPADGYIDENRSAGGRTVEITRATRRAVHLCAKAVGDLVGQLSGALYFTSTEIRDGFAME